ncbi:MAG: hypothetical protein ABI629_01985 [bacterium]
MLEQRGLLGEDGESARTLVDSSIGAVYEAIHAITREVGELASGLFEGLETTPMRRRSLASPRPGTPSSAAGP